jgi:hypothetical protein
MGRTQGAPQDPLIIEDMAVILQFAETLSAAEISRRLEKNYFTVAAAVRRARRGQLRSSLSWTPCAECGKPIAGPVGRTVHEGCEQARRNRWARERRAASPGSSTPHVRAWRAEHPEEDAMLREREKARLRERWPDLPEHERQESLQKVHDADARDQPITQVGARRARERWTEEEDKVVLSRLHDPAREVALDLGRTLWAVRHRRSVLRRRIEQGEEGR